MGYKGGKRKTVEYRDLSSASYTWYTGDFETSLGTYGGQGKYVWACGKVYTGGFQSGLPHGHATLEILAIGDMRVSLSRGKCTVRERLLGRTEPATKDNSTMG